MWSRSSLRYIILAALSVGAALLGLGLSAPLITPTSPNLTGIHDDGWIEDGAEIALPGLLHRGNQLELTFNPWRPPGNAPAVLQLHVCGVLAGQAEISEQTPSTAIFLTGTCEPRVVRITGTNTFVPSASDTRALTSQLISAQLNSRAGLALYALEEIAPVAAALFAGGALATAALPGALLAGGTYILFGGALVWTAGLAELSLLTPLWAFSLALLFGVALARRHEGTRPIELPSQPTPHEGLLLLAIVLLGAALRIHGITFGFPQNYHPDEVPKVNAIMRMVAAGNLDPDYFLHPSLLLYSTYFVNTLFHLFGLPLEPLIGTAGGFRESAFLAGRTVSCIAGIGSVYLTYLLGARLFSARVGLIGAALLAVYPLHVVSSRYLKEDSLMIFLTLATMVAAVTAAQRRSRGWTLLAAFLAGVTASSKYSGILMGGVVLGIPWLCSRGIIPDWRMLRITLGALLLIPVGFVLCTPYSILNFDRFISHFDSEREHMLRGHNHIVITAWSQYWMYHFARSILPGMTNVGAMLSVIAVGFLLWRRRIEDLTLVGFVLLFYLPAEWVKAKPSPQAERYIVPCLPFLGLATAALIQQLRLNARGVASVGLLLTAFCFPLIRTLELSSEVIRDTRVEMREWMLANIPRGSRVLLEWPSYSPAFKPDEFQVTYIPLAEIMEYVSIGRLQSTPHDYLVVSSFLYDRYFTQPNAQPARREVFRDLFRRVPLIKQIRPQFGTYGFHNPTLNLFSLNAEDFARLTAEVKLKEQGQLVRTSNEERAPGLWRRSAEEK